MPMRDGEVDQESTIKWSNGSRLMNSGEAPSMANKGQKG
jgi:hypothetical protein